MFISSVTGFILFCAILKIIYTQVRKRTKLLDKIITLTDKSVASDESQTSYNFRKQLYFMKRAAQQISEDRQSIGTSVLEFHSHFQTRFSEEIEPIKPLLEEALCTSLQQKYSTQNKQMDEIFETLETIKSDFLTLKDELQASFSNHRMDRKEPDFDSGEVDSILIEVKENFAKLISENRFKEKEMFQTISNFLRQSQTDICKEMKLFHSAAGGNEVLNEENLKLTLETALDGVERMKTNLISTCIFLNRQCSEMEEIRQTVQYFDQKVAYFILSSDKLSNRNKMVTRRLEESEIIHNSLIEKIDRNANNLKRQSRIFTRALTNAKNALLMNDLDIDGFSLPVSKHLEGPSLEFADSTDTVWIENIDVLKEKLKTFLNAVKSNKEKLESLEHTARNLEQFHDLMKSMTRGYNTLLRFFLYTLVPPQKIGSRYDPKIKLQHNEEGSINSTGAYNKGNSFRHAGEMKEKFPHDVVWDEKQLNIKFQNADKYALAFLLKDIMRTAWKLIDEDRMMPGGICETDVQADNYKQWGDFPSESLLTDVSSELLIHSSDESTLGTSDINIRL